MFSLTPQTKYQATLNNLVQTLENKTIVYYLDKSDLYQENTSISNETSNQPVPNLSPSISAEIDILKPANYTLLINAAGYQKVEVDQKEYNVLSQQGNLTYFGPIYLTQGKHKIEISYNDEASVQEFSDATEIWLYSAPTENNSLNDILNPSTNTAAIINFQKVDSTTYRLEVNATQPFMLSFAQDYDPLWIATVNGVKIQPTSLYSLINGYWVNQTGLLDITIEYAPQQWFYYGSLISAVSIITLIVCITFKKTIKITRPWFTTKKIRK
jgi:hypothetical protein